MADPMHGVAILYTSKEYLKYFILYSESIVICILTNDYNNDMNTYIYIII